VKQMPLSEGQNLPIMLDDYMDVGK